MIELVFVACLVASPGACEERSLTFLDQSGPVGCMMQAPSTLATWVDEQVKVCDHGPNKLVTSRKPDDLKAFCETYLEVFGAEQAV